MDEYIVPIIFGIISASTVFNFFAVITVYFKANLVIMSPQMTRKWVSIQILGALILSYFMNEYYYVFEKFYWMLFGGISLGLILSLLLYLKLPSKKKNKKHY